MNEDIFEIIFILVTLIFFTMINYVMIDYLIKKYNKNPAPIVQKKPSKKVVLNEEKIFKLEEI